MYQNRIDDRSRKVLNFKKKLKISYTKIQAKKIHLEMELASNKFLSKNFVQPIICSTFAN